MKNIDPQTPIWKLTVEEFLEVCKELSSEGKYEYGLKGLAKLLGCSVSKASEIKSSGILNNAIIQRGNIIIINKEKALKILRSRLYEIAEAERNKGISDERKSQVGTGDRSERIRTYNYPQGRVTDHRINLTLYKLDSFLEGDMDEMFDSLIRYDQAEKLKAMGSRAN